MMPKMTEKQRMDSGLLYWPGDNELATMQARCRALVHELNRCPPGSEARPMLEKLLGAIGKGTNIAPGFQCDYGVNIFLGENVGLNYNCVLLDCGRIEIGSYTQLGPGVHIYAVTHPEDPIARRGGFGKRNCQAKTVTIGQDCWIGGGTCIMPGVEIGDGAIIGCNSIVRENVPAYTKVAGSPARVIGPVRRKSKTA